MYVFLRNRSNDIKEPIRHASASVFSLSIKNPETGQELANPPVSKKIGTTLQLSALRGDASITLDQGVEIGKWWLISNDGPREVVNIKRMEANVAHLATPLTDSYEVGALLEPYFLEAQWNPDSNVPSYVILEWTVDDEIYTRDAVVVNRKLVPPLTGEELFELFPRLREFGSTDRSANQGDSWISESWEILRSKFFQNGIILDNIRSGEMLREALLAQVGLLFAMQGVDLSGMGDPLEYQREAERRLNREIARLSRSNVWVDRDDDGILDAGEDNAIGLRFTW